MPSAVRLREDYSAEELRGLARRSKDVNQSRRLLSLAGVRDGMDRGAAARIGGMERQTLRDCPPVSERETVLLVSPSRTRGAGARGVGGPPIDSGLRARGSLHGRPL